MSVLCTFRNIKINDLLSHPIWRFYDSQELLEKLISKQNGWWHHLRLDRQIKRSWEEKKLVIQGEVRKMPQLGPLETGPAASGEHLGFSIETDRPCQSSPGPTPDLASPGTTYQSPTSYCTANKAKTWGIPIAVFTGPLKLPSPRIGLQRELGFQGKGFHCSWLGKSFCHLIYVLSWARLEEKLSCTWKR